jgi:adenylosuccinate synthase
MIHSAVAVIGLAYGDEGKGAITHSLARNAYFNMVLRTSGGSNAGHTIIHEGRKVATHQIPAGVFWGKLSVIGNGCVVNPDKLLEEVRTLERMGIDALPHLKIAYNAHVVMPHHIEEEARESTIGTTRQGIGPAYRDKYARTGKRAEDIPWLKPYLIDMYDYLKSSEGFHVLCEGAQGFNLDIDWCSDYPYCTSSNSGIASIVQCGIPHTRISKVIGAVKAYDTYVGSKQFEDRSNPIFSKIREVGAEYGATTGRPRQVNCLNTDSLLRAVTFNQVSHVVVSKGDVLEKAGVPFTVLEKGIVRVVGDRKDFANYLEGLGLSVSFRWAPDDPALGHTSDGLEVLFSP